MADLIPFEFCHQNSLEIANQRLICARQKISQFGFEVDPRTRQNLLHFGKPVSLPWLDHILAEHKVAIEKVARLGAFQERGEFFFHKQFLRQQGYGVGREKITGDQYAAPFDAILASQGNLAKNSGMVHNWLTL